MKKKDMSLFKQVITEYKQVIWPTKLNVVQVTIVVLLLTLFITTMILLFDITFRTTMNNFQIFIKSLIG